jgi:hypothetical protein
VATNPHHQQAAPGQLVRSLSGGLRSRVSLATAQLGEPRLPKVGVTTSFSPAPGVSPVLVWGTTEQVCPVRSISKGYCDESRVKG